MVRPVTVVLAMAACGLIAGCGQARASVPPSRYLVCSDIVGPCAGVTPEHKPASLLMSGDGSLYAQHITWSGWGTATATGRGTAEANNCQPDCAGGTYSAHPVTITLTRPESWHHDMVYTRAAYSIPSLDLSNAFTNSLPGQAPAAPPIAAPSVPPVPSPVSTQAARTGN
jgi:hypothetical protein